MLWRYTENGKNIENKHNIKDDSSSGGNILLKVAIAMSILSRYAKKVENDTPFFLIIDEVSKLQSKNQNLIKEYINKNGFSDENLMHILSSFQEAVCDLLSFKVMKAAQRYGIKRIVVGGGVAANKRLREVFSEKAATSNLDVRFSSTQLCTDNGAMIAVTGYNYYKKGIVSSLDIRGYSRMAMS